MLVPARRERTRPALVSKRDSFARRDFADARQRKLGKLFFPRIEQKYSIFARNREKQLEIFAIRQRRKQRGLGGRFSARRQLRSTADRNRGREQFRPHVACLQNVPQVAR